MRRPTSREEADRWRRWSTEVSRTRPSATGEGRLGSRPVARNGQSAGTAAGFRSVHWGITRRRGACMLKRVGSLALASGLTVASAWSSPQAPAASAASGAASPSRPNILLIVPDDVGFWNVGAYSHGMMVPTPSIDRIAREGMLFTDHYGQPTCTPGRAALITGQLPIRTGLTTVGHGGVADRPRPARPDARRGAEAARLPHRPVRQEPPRRPQRAPADRPRLRRVLRQPLPPQHGGGARAAGVAEGRRLRPPLPAREASSTRWRPTSTTRPRTRGSAGWAASGSRTPAR